MALTRLVGAALAALAIAALVHIDWHLGRAAHSPLSFNFHYHWILAVPATALG